MYSVYVAVQWLASTVYGLCMHRKSLLVIKSNTVTRRYTVLICSDCSDTAQHASLQIISVSVSARTVCCVVSLSTFPSAQTSRFLEVGQETPDVSLLSSTPALPKSDQKPEVEDLFSAHDFDIQIDLPSGPAGYCVLLNVGPFCFPLALLVSRLLGYIFLVIWGIYTILELCSVFSES